MDKRVRRWILLLFFCIMCVAFVSPQNVAKAASASKGKIEGRWIHQNGKTYFRLKDGTLWKGWLVRNGHKFYMNTKTGAKATGWRNIDGKRYYFRPSNGRVVTGWFTVNKKRFYAFSNGILKTGWLSDKGNRYYLRKDRRGVMQTGWAKIKGKKYYFYPDGRLAVKIWLDEDHYVDSKGVLRLDMVKNKKNTFRWPLDSSWNRISSPFGYRGPMPIGTSNHDGIDIPANMGTPIYAARSGTIVRREYSDSAGNYIEIDHKNGLVSVYMHMTSFQSGIRVGSKVKRGQVIGYVGSTGWSTGPHLHFGVKMNGQVIDPINYVRQP